MLESGLEESLAEPKVPGPGQPETPFTESEPRISNAKRGTARNFGDYELLEEIARGGMGVVYRARQLSLGRIVALKMILAGPLASKHIIQRFRGEVTAAALLQHPNIVAIHDVGVHDGQHYFSMDYVEGQNLSQLVGNRPLPPGKAARYVKLIAEAIHYAHQQGILHRDLKPSNVLVDASDQPRITDFGLAKRFGSDSQLSTHDAQLTLTGQMLGSPNFMPPEQASSQRGKVGRHSDVYGLGAILYYLLTARPPFQAESFESVITQLLNTEPVSPRLLNSSVPPDLETICVKCLQKEPSRRYQSAQELADELGRFLHGEPIHARPVTRAERAWRWCRRKPVVASLGGVTLVLLFVIFIGSPIAALRIDRARKLAEVRLYAANMNAAQQAFEYGNLGRARDFLKAHWPKRGEPDLRGFEWRYLWNLCQGDNFHTFPGHSNVVSCVAFSPDGRTLASGSADSAVKLWDVANRRLLATLPAYTNSADWLAFSNDGETLATVGDEGLIKLWNIKTHQLIFTMKEKRAARIAVSPVGTLLAIGYGHPVYGDDIGGPIKLWDYVSHQVVRIFPEPGSRIAFSPDGKILAARGSNEVVKLWKVEAGEEMGKLENDGDVLCLAFSPDGQTLATGNWAGEAQLWNVAAGKRGLPLQGHTGGVWSLAFSPDGKILATGSSDQTLRLWNVATGKEESKLIGHGSEVWAVAFAPDGRTLATGGKDEMVMLWSTAPKGAEVVLTSVNLSPSFSPDNKLLATAKMGGPVTVWNVATRQPVWVLNSERFAQFPTEGGTLATIGTNFILRFWDVATQTLQRAVPLPGFTDSTQQLCFSLRGNCLAGADNDGFVTLFEATTGGLIRKFKGHVRDNDALTFSPNARLLATVDESRRSVKLWDVATQKLLATASVHKESVEGLAFSPDGSLLASAGYDGRVGFLRVATGQVETPLTGIKEGCSGVAFSPDGRTLAVACEDGTVRLWNLATEREVAVLRHGKSELRYVVFSPDGQTLVSVGHNGTLRFWDAPRPATPQPRKEE
ncbi:MAG: WD40 repeat domain-containing serine/threonine protein kinase [Limisphaerales bacterium]